MKHVGLIGWRGMVGSVLMHRMQQEHDFNYFHSTFFSTSQIGEKAPKINKNQNFYLQDAQNLELLNSMDIIITCQGSSYTSIIYPKLRKIGWTGFWIDSASYLRMHNDTIIVLDPVNKLVIEQGINNNIKTFVGGNCTISLMLMALGGLFSENLIEWVFTSTYQAASGYGARAIRELLVQISQVHKSIANLLTDSTKTVLDIENIITQLSRNNILPTDCFKVPLIGNVIPWIGNHITQHGQTQEEWKGQLETNKILNATESIPISSLCVRVCSLRCHSQAFIIKLKKNICLTTIETLLKNHNIWVEVVQNNTQDSLNKLTPISVSGKLSIPIGRLHKMNIGNKYLAAFTVGDQLLWGAAEPLRRMLRQLL